MAPELLIKEPGRDEKQLIVPDMLELLSVIQPLACESC